MTRFGWQGKPGLSVRRDQPSTERLQAPGFPVRPGCNEDGLLALLFPNCMVWHAQAPHATVTLG